MSPRNRRRTSRRRLPHSAGPPPRQPRRRGRLGRVRDVVNSPVVAGWFLVLCCVGAAFGAVIAHDKTTALRDRGVRTTAEVLEVHDGKSAWVLVSFVDSSGREVQAEVGSWYWDPEPRVGERRDVLYDPDDPEGNVTDVRLPPDFVAMWFFVVGSVVAAMLVPGTFRGTIDWDRFDRWRR